MSYGLEFLWNRGYKPNQPPHFMLRDYMAKTAQLEQFDEELYKVTDDGEKQTDKYLIATSEQPLSALHDGEWLQDKDLPIKYVLVNTLRAPCSNDSQVCGLQHMLSQRSWRSWKRCLGDFPRASI